MITKEDLFTLKNRVDILFEKLEGREEARQGNGEHNQTEKNLLNSCLLSIITLEDLVKKDGLKDDV